MRFPTWATGPLGWAPSFLSALWKHAALIRVNRNHAASGARWSGGGGVPPPIHTSVGGAQGPRRGGGGRRGGRRGAVRLALALGKQLFYRQIETGMAAAYDDAAQTMACNMMDTSALEGVQAFIDKRKPNW